MEAADVDVVLGKPVIPGELFHSHCPSSDVSFPVTHGPGLQFLSRETDPDEDAENEGICTFRVAAAGVLNRSAKNENVFFVNSVSSYQYDPVVGDSVVGLVVGRTVDYYRVAIRSRELAFLGQLSFEGATKRNRPDVQIGEVVFARVSAVAPGIGSRQAELVCFNPETNKAEGMGVLRDPNIVASQTSTGSPGLVFSLETSQQVQSLISKKNRLIRLLGKRIPFEGAYGYNGVVWVRARSVRETILVANLIQALTAAKTDDKEWTNKLIDAAMNRLSGIS